MNRPARQSVLVFLGLCGAGLAGAATPPPAEPVLLQAMKAEIGRSRERLRLEQMDGPYFVEYAVDDLETMNLSASFGALLAVSGVLLIIGSFIARRFANRAAQ